MISKYYSLEMLTKSQEAQRHNVKEQYTPDELVVRKLTALCTNCLDKMQDAVKKAYPTARINQTSGYRCPRVNTLAGGQPTSQHMAGEASDQELIINGKEENLLLAQLILKEGIVFDQMILEYGTLQKPEWIHLSWDLDKAVQRNMIMRIGHNAEGKFQCYQTTKNTVLNLK